MRSETDGIQDYEYAQILRNLGETDFLNSVVRPIAVPWTGWTQDPNALKAARRQLGQRLNQLALRV